MRTDRKGPKAMWLKVYAQREGIEDFSDGTKDETRHETILDDGTEQLDEDQVDQHF